MKGMKRSNFLIVSTILGALVSISPVTFQAKVLATQKSDCTVHRFMRATDLCNETIFKQKDTASSRDVSKDSTETTSFNHQGFARSTVNRFLDTVPDFISRTDYFYTEIDLNEDGNKEIILAIFSPACGAWECNGYILQKNDLQYEMIGEIPIVSTGGEIIAIQRNVSNGFIDIASQIFTPTTGPVWKLHQFDGNAYMSTYQNTSPGSVILNVERGAGLRL